MSRNSKIEIYPILLDEPLHPRDAGQFDIADLIVDNFEINDRDILIIASKIVSILDGRCIALKSVTPSKKSGKIARVYNKNPELIELIRREGNVLFVFPGGRLLKNPIYSEMVSQLAKPGLLEEDKNRILDFSVSHRWAVIKHGYLADNAGIDCQNVPEGYAVLLPEDPTRSAEDIRNKLKEKTGKTVAVLITDSLGAAATLGIWDIPLGFAGIDPVERKGGEKDVFGRVGSGGFANYILPLSSMGGIVMGNSDECTPIAVIRGFEYNDPRPEDKGKDILSIPVSFQIQALFWTIMATIRYFFVWLLPGVFFKTKGSEEKSN